MKRLFWDVLIDSNTYRTFETGLDTEGYFKIKEMLRSGESVYEQWQTMKVQLWEGDKGYKRKEKKKPVADFMSTTLMPLISLRGREKIEPLIANQVEFLPFETSVGPYYGLHIKYVDCLDEELSQVDYLYPEEKREIYSVSKYAFYWEKLQNVHIFRLPNVIHTSFFVSDEFRRVVEENGLTGLLFYPVPLVEE